MRVTFDTNALDKAVRPGRHPKDPNQPLFQKVHEALKSTVIEGFVCETMITLEGIPKNAFLGPTVHVLRSTRRPRQVQL